MSIKQFEDDVVKAFRSKTLKLEPQSNVFLSFNALGFVNACPVGACFYKHNTPADSDFLSSIKQEQFCVRKYRLSNDFVRGVEDGWDNNSKSFTSRSYKLGFKTGEKLWKRIAEKKKK